MSDLRLSYGIDRVLFNRSKGRQTNRDILYVTVNDGV